MTTKQRKRIYLAFEFEKDNQRKEGFIQQAQDNCDYSIIDKSLSQEVHDKRWQREAKLRIQNSIAMIVLLGEDTHNSPGVADELSLAGEVKTPVIQLQPQKKKYGKVNKQIPCVRYTWNNINNFLKNPQEFILNLKK